MEDKKYGKKIEQSYLMMASWIRLKMHLLN